MNAFLEQGDKLTWKTESGKCDLLVMTTRVSDEPLVSLLDVESGEVSIWPYTKIVEEQQRGALTRLVEYLPNRASLRFGIDLDTLYNGATPTQRREEQRRRLAVQAYDRARSEGRGIHDAIDQVNHALTELELAPVKRSTLLGWIQQYRKQGHLLPKKAGYPKGQSRLAPALIDAIHKAYKIHKKLNASELDMRLIATIVRNQTKDTPLPSPPDARHVRTVLRRELGEQGLKYADFSQRDKANAMRATTGEFQADRPMQTVQVDATRAVIKVMKKDGEVTLTDCTLYLATCVYLKTPVAYLLADSAGNARHAIELVARCILPKLGYPNAPYGYVEGVVTDGGPEFRSHEFKQAMKTLFIDVAEVARPWDKPHVERCFKMVQDDLIKHLPGSTIQVGLKAVQRDAGRAKKTGALEQQQLDHTLSKFFYDVNLSHPFAEGKPVDGCRTAGDLWQYNLAHRAPLVHVTPEQLATQLQISGGKRRLHHYGLDFDGIRYGDANLHAWISDKNRPHDVEVWYCPWLADRVWLERPDTHERMCVFAQRHEDFAHRSFEEVRRMRKADHDAHKELQNIYDDQRHALIQETASMANPVPAGTKYGRMKTKRDLNAADQQRAAQIAQALDGTVPSPAPTVVVQPLAADDFSDLLGAPMNGQPDHE